MQKYLALISEFLQKEESCFLPGIGVLKCTHLPAIEKDGKILPPSSKIQLDRSGKEARHSITEEIKNRFNLSEQEAQKEWENVTDRIKKESKPLSIPGMGLLKKNKEGTIQFLAFKTSPLYRAVYLPDVIQPPEKEVPYPFEEEVADSNKKWYIWIPIIILAVCALGYFGYQYLSGASSVKAQKDSAIQSQESATPASAMDSISTQQSKNTAAQTTDSIYFAIIFKTFRTQSGAENFSQKMHSWGHAVSVYQKDSSHFLIGYPYYGPPSDTTLKLENIQDIYGGKPFIFYPKK